MYDLAGLTYTLPLPMLQSTIIPMPKPRGRNHTTLTQTSALVVSRLEKMPGIKMIAPGKITTSSKNRTGSRHGTIVHTKAGCELIISGQGTQKIAVHLVTATLMPNLIQTLKKEKTLAAFHWHERYTKLNL